MYQYQRGTSCCVGLCIAPGYQSRAAPKVSIDGLDDLDGLVLSRQGLVRRNILVLVVKRSP